MNIQKILLYTLSIIVICSLFLLLRSSVSKGEKIENFYIKLKQSDSLESKLDEKTFVAILAPWCGFCKKIKESGVLEKLSKKIKVIEIDDKHPQAEDIMESANSEGFPTLIIYKNNNFYKYKGDRSLNSLLNFIK